MSKKKTGNYVVEIEQLRLALDNVPSYVYIKNEESRYIYANKLTLELFGCSEETLYKFSDNDFFPPDTVRQLKEVDQKVLQGEHTQEEITVKNPDGSKVVYWEVKTPIFSRSEPNNIIGILGISTDITRSKELEEELLQAATTDALTGLPNRRLFIDRLSHALLISKRENTYGAVIFIDLDHFKKLNDTYGHGIGDLYLIEVAHRITMSVRDYDTVARLGGDEFVVLLENLGPDENQARKVANTITNKIQIAICSSDKISDIVYQGSASIGTSLFCNSQQSEHEILTEADKLMYQNKRSRY